MAKLSAARKFASKQHTDVFGGCNYLCSYQENREET